MDDYISCFKYLLWRSNFTVFTLIGLNMKINDMNITIYKDPTRGYINRLQISYNDNSYCTMGSDDKLWCSKSDPNSIKKMMNTITEAVLSIINDGDIPE